MGHASVVGRQSGSFGRGHSPPLIEHAQMRQPHTPASRACAICKPRGEAKHTGRWHFRTGRQPAGRRALTAEDHCSSSRRVRHLVFPLPTPPPLSFILNAITPLRPLSLFFSVVCVFFFSFPLCPCGLRARVME